MSNIQNAVEGAAASILANTIVYPLDLVKTVIQTQEKNAEYKNTLDALAKIRQDQGVQGWYSGIGSSILGSAAQSFSYFYWYSAVRRSYAALKLKRKSERPGYNSAAEELLLGAVAAALGQLITSPIGVVATRQQTDPEHNRTPLQAARNIINEDGITGLWRGLKVSLVLTTNPAITYAAFEKLKPVLFGSTATLTGDVTILQPHQSFILGVISKMLATVITQPLIVSKAVLQRTSSAKSFQSVLRKILETEGIFKLWKGVLPQLTKGVLVQGLIFMFKDQIKLLLSAIFTILKLQRAKALKSF